MNDIKKNIIIKCPKCGYEYLASEIFFPEDLIGKAQEIVRDDNGKILVILDGEEPHLEEPWECDHCGCDFVAKLDVKASVEYNEDKDFSEEYVLESNTDKEKLF